MLAFDKAMLYSEGMDKAFEMACDIVGAANLARLLDVSPQAISSVKKGDRPVPIPWCPEIEKATEGRVTRKDLRPDDWAKLWPELADSGKRRRRTDKKNFPAA